MCANDESTAIPTDVVTGVRSKKIIHDSGQAHNRSNALHTHFVHGQEAHGTQVSQRGDAEDSLRNDMTAGGWQLYLKRRI